MSEPQAQALFAREGNGLVARLVAQDVEAFSGGHIPQLRSAVANSVLEGDQALLVCAERLGLRNAVAIDGWPWQGSFFTTPRKENTKDTKDTKPNTQNTWCCLAALAFESIAFVTFVFFVFVFGLT